MCSFRGATKEDAMTDENAGDRILGTLLTDNGEGVVRMEDRFDAGVDEVWSALTDPARLAAWYGEVEGDLRVGGQYRARLHASGWSGVGRIEACERPERLLVKTRMDADQTEGETGEIEITLTAQGEQTSVVWEERGMPVKLLGAYGAGIQVHVEDLRSYLAGGPRRDANARWQELSPAYQQLAAEVR
jgi:uncharacterized protein YndB with AHSA1/START domain